MDKEKMKKKIVRALKWLPGDVVWVVSSDAYNRGEKPVLKEVVITRTDLMVIGDQIYVEIHSEGESQRNSLRGYWSTEAKAQKTYERVLRVWEADQKRERKKEVERAEEILGKRNKEKE